MNIREIHTIERIEGNRVKLKNPIHLSIKLVKGEDFSLYSYIALEECGIEDILFTSNWKTYPESFIHHKNAIHDRGWCAVSLENLRSEEHTSELQSLMRISYAVFCLKKKHNIDRTS